MNSIKPKFLHNHRKCDHFKSVWLEIIKFGSIMYLGWMFKPVEDGCSLTFVSKVKVTLSKDLIEGLGCSIGQFSCFGWHKQWAECIRMGMQVILPSYISPFTDLNHTQIYFNLATKKRCIANWLCWIFIKIPWHNALVQLHDTWCGGRIPSVGRIPCRRHSQWVDNWNSHRGT